MPSADGIHDDTHDQKKDQNRTGLLIVGLAVTVANLSLLQTLVVRVLSLIAQQLHASLASVGCSAASTPSPDCRRRPPTT
jgi:hypothetical protein